MLIRLLQLTCFWALSATGSAVPAPPAAARSPLTAGWTERAYTYEVQHPYDLPLAARYSYDKREDIHDLWVFITDKPHLPPPNRTTPRTEIALERYSSGPHMFDADYYIEPGTFACIMQLFRGDEGPGLMLVVTPDGRLAALDSNRTLASHVYGHWFNLKVIHNPGVRNGVSIYINDVLRGTDNLRRSREYYFKCGVYSREKSERSEVLIHAIRYWVRGPATRP